jgi:ketosteroid isomerase-like protein
MINRRNTGIAMCAALLLLLSCTTTSDAPPAPPSLAASVGTYGAAWASRDVDRILALHTDDTEFRLFVGAVEAAQGRDAVRQQFNWILQTNPTYSSRTVSVEISTDAATIEYVIAMSPKAPFRMGQWEFTPSGETYDLHAVDVIYFENGLVRAKHTYLDFDSIRRNSRSAVLVP